LRRASYSARNRIQEGLHRGFAVAVLTRMRVCPIVLGEPFIQIRLQFLQAGVELFAKCRGVTLFLNRAMETFADAIGLRVPGLGPLWSMFSTARYSSYSWCSRCPQYSVPRSVNIGEAHSCRLTRTSASFPSRTASRTALSSALHRNVQRGSQRCVPGGSARENKIITRKELPCVLPDVEHGHELRLERNSDSAALARI
jgi:hypothetical protein